MRQVSLIALVSVFALFLGGCPSDDGGGETATNTPTPAPVASPISPKAAPSATPFANPLTPKKPGNSTAVAGLVQSLSPDAVAKQMAKGRSDPFASIPLQPEVTVSPNPGAGGGTTNSPVPVVPPLPGVPRTRGGGTGGQQPGARTGARTGPIARNQPRAPRGSQGNVLPPPPRQGSAARPRTQTPAPNRRPGSLPPVVATAPRFRPDLPKLPEPTLARGIGVTGVVEVGGEPRAIIKVPNEPDRTVREGDRLLNGQVLVKRIEVNGPTPVVILEQYGVEVARRIGEQPAGGVPGTEPGPPTASLPSLRLGNTDVLLKRDIYV